YTDEWYSAPTYMPDGLLLGNDPKLLDDIINYKEPESIPYPWEGLNKSTYGLRLGEFTLFMADTGIGKALALDTPIPTPSGWTTMGDLRPGDKVFDETGKPCNVVRVTEPMTDRICYDVIFDDGTVITADEEHNWFVYSKNERSKGKEGKVRTTAELDRK